MQVIEGPVGECCGVLLLHGYVVVDRSVLKACIGDADRLAVVVVVHAIRIRVVHIRFTVYPMFSWP